MKFDREPGWWGLILLVCLVVSAQAASSDRVDKIVDQFDSLYRSQHSYSEIDMEIDTPHWSRTLQMNVWTEELDKTFIRITAPLKEKGVATLRIKTEMWNYLPKTNKVIKIPPSMMMNSWMGSDFTNDDLVREFTWRQDYTYKLVTPPEAKPGLLYVELIPREGRPIVWGSVLLAVRETDYLPVWQKYFDDRHQLMRVLYFKDIKEFDGRKVPAVLEMVPRTKEGHRTVIRYRTLDFHPKVDRDIFSLRNLHSKR